MVADNLLATATALLLTVGIDNNLAGNSAAAATKTIRLTVPIPNRCVAWPIATLL